MFQAINGEGLWHSLGLQQAVGYGVKDSLGNCRKIPTNIMLGHNLLLSVEGDILLQGKCCGAG